jgi:hypothetical protein
VLPLHKIILTDDSKRATCGETSSGTARSANVDQVIKTLNEGPSNKHTHTHTQTRKNPLPPTDFKTLKVFASNLKIYTTARLLS